VGLPQKYIFIFIPSHCLPHIHSAMDQMKNPFASLHRDVLDASPVDEAGKTKLLEELRDRAKGAIASKQYPAADLLYSKAIELITDDATLFGNRSMVRLTLGKFKEALEDAEKCLSLDSSYSKGYYRKGQACTKLNMHSEAAEAYEGGSKLEPDNKTFKSLAESARKAAEDAANAPPPLVIHQIDCVEMKKFSLAFSVADLSPQNLNPLGGNDKACD
jgi:tetratricopeptide (TPR) repeat protein